MEAARAVSAAHDGLFDIRRPRRPADEVDAARQRALAEDCPYPVPGLFVGADNVGSGDEDGVSLRQEVQSGRVVSARR